MHLASLDICTYSPWSIILSKLEQKYLLSRKLFLQCDFNTLPIKKWYLSSFLLNLGISVEYNRSDTYVTSKAKAFSPMGDGASL